MTGWTNYRKKSDQNKIINERNSDRLNYYEIFLR